MGAYDLTTSCTKCNGSGDMDCEPCNGSGYDFGDGGQCDYCGGMGDTQCDKCYGSGRQRADEY